jgi:hypothetical protein
MVVKATKDEEVEESKVKEMKEENVASDMKQKQEFTGAAGSTVSRA